MKKVLIVTSEYPPYGSGIANVVLTLRSQLAKKGIEASVLSRCGANVNITSPLNNFSGLVGLLPFWRQALKYAMRNAHKYDLIWLHSPLALNTGRLGNDKILVSIHTTYLGFYQAYKKHKINRLLPYYHVASLVEHHFFSELRNYDNVRVTAVSTSVAEEVRNNGLSYLPNVIPNGIDVDNSMSMSKEDARDFIRKEYSLDVKLEDPVFFYLGRITEQKQPFRLIDYFRQLNIINPRARLIICGKGNLMAKLKKKAECEQNVLLLGYVSSKNLPILMKASDAFISLSCYEGLPLTVLEASAHGLPLILSKIPPHEELVRSKVGTGLLLGVDVPRPEAVLMYIKGLKATVDNRDSVKRQFSWDSITDQYLRLLR